MSTPADFPVLVARLRELLEEATPGPWSVYCQHFIGGQRDGAHAFAASTEAGAEGGATAALIVAMHAALPFLLDALDADTTAQAALVAECERLRSELLRVQDRATTTEARLVTLLLHVQGFASAVDAAPVVAVGPVLYVGDVVRPS